MTAKVIRVNGGSGAAGSRSQSQVTVSVRRAAPVSRRTVGAGYAHVHARASWWCEAMGLITNPAHPAVVHQRTMLQA